MTKLKIKTEPSGYDTSINIIGGLKDCSVIFKAIDAFFNQDDSVNDLVANRNEFNLRTEKSRVRIVKAVNCGFLQFYNEDHRQLIQRIFKSTIPLPERELVLYWQFALNNRLFREISIQVFSKIYFSGRSGIHKDDIIAYLKEFVNKTGATNLRWSESTIETLATKYLNLMTKLSLLEGARTKSFKHIKPTAELLTIFLYFAKLYNPKNSNILTNEFLLLSFIAPEDIQTRLKKLSLKGFLNMNFNGVALNVELTHSYQGICDVLYN
jgi:bacteriophage exclusion system BrxA-like protein